MYYIMYVLLFRCYSVSASVALRSKRSQKSGENYEDIKLTLIRFKVFQGVARHDNVL